MITIISFIIICLSALSYFHIEGQHDAILTTLVNKTSNMVEDWKQLNTEWHILDAIHNVKWWLISVLTFAMLYSVEGYPVWVALLWFLQFAFARRFWFESGINYYRKLDKYHMSNDAIDQLELRLFRTAQRAYYMRFIGWLVLSAILVIIPLAYN